MRPMALEGFHPLTAGWFQSRFPGPTEPQAQGWPRIASGHDVLIAAPTGSGKTLAAFLAGIDVLVRQAADGRLADEPQILYVSPLKALSNDIHKNLSAPLAEIQEFALQRGQSLPELRVAVRTGDTPPRDRQAMLRRRPHIVVTTPESCYLLLTSRRGRELLRSVRTVIVDEIHALARDKRGSHLSLSLARLDQLCGARPQRVGLSATQRPLDRMAHFLVGAQADGQPYPCEILDEGHIRQLDLGIETPPTPLSAVCSNDHWAEIDERICQLIIEHRSTLIFVNTRRLAERVCGQLAERLGEEAVASHHGSLSRELRLSAEQRLKEGRLKAIVATASLELGIDVGYIDLVCQIGSPRSIATFLQRVGRAGHSLGKTPKGRLFPLTRDSLIECLALTRSVRAGRLDRVLMPEAPLDILAQQIVAMVTVEEQDEDELYELVRRAWPYRQLRREDYEEVVRMLSEGFSPRSRRDAYLHRDVLHRRLRYRRRAKLAALTSSGAIPEQALFRVVAQPEGTQVGTLDEDFAIESMVGDIFVLGSTSWRILAIRGGEVAVEDAHGAPATVPFWLGEAPARTAELSAEVAQLREEIAERLAAEGPGAASRWLQASSGAAAGSADQAVEYVAAQRAALGLVPTQRRIVFERFFDDTGGMQMVIHSPLGARINKAWGLALRKRFCRSFNFELQAAADDNGIVLSLGPQHSFPLEQMFTLVNPGNARLMLEQAMLDAPMFKVRWRWNATRALAVLRQNGGRKVPPPLQRFRSDDLLSEIFPMSTACLENVVGDIEIPDHPLVRQTVHDCLTEAMDFDGWLGLLQDIKDQRIEMAARDTREPSPFCYELLNANPYAFLDDAPLEERRTRALATRRTLDPADMQNLCALDAEAIALVREGAWPLVRDADELHELLLSVGAWSALLEPAWRTWFDELAASGRALEIALPAGPRLWIATERWSLLRLVYAGAEMRAGTPREMPLPQGVSEVTATIDLVRGQADCRGPITAESLAAELGLRPSAVAAALEALEGEGAVLRGRFTPGRPDDAPLEWCERRLLARIHRHTLAGLREKVRPVEPAVFMQFLLEHQHALPGRQLERAAGVAAVIEQLQGCELPAGAWLHDVLPARVADFDPAWLDELAMSGELAWGRLQPPQRAPDGRPRQSGLHRAVPLGIFLRDDVDWLLPPERSIDASAARGDARQVHALLEQRGAAFFDELMRQAGMLPGQLEMALAELAALGLASADTFAPLRALAGVKRQAGHRLRVGAREGAVRRGFSRGGRWARFPGPTAPLQSSQRAARWARQLLLRYGVVFSDLLRFEPLAPRWRELAAVWRREEARGEIRGGRFVAGVGGEQYALPEVVERLRRLRDEPKQRQTVVLSAADPLNLSGSVLPGPRVPAQRTGALALIDGCLAASQSGGEITWHGELSLPEQADLARRLRASGLRYRSNYASESLAQRLGRVGT